MDDIYFDDKMKEILESPPEFEPDVDALLDMQKRLKTLQPPVRRKGFLPFWWPFMLLLPFLFGFIYFFQKYNKLNEQVELLSNQYSMLTLTDSLTKRHITYQYDTIYRVIYETQYVSESVLGANYLPNLRYQISGLSSPIRNDSYFNVSKQVSGWSLRSNLFSLLEIRPGSSFISYDTTAITPENNKQTLNTPLPNLFTSTKSLLNYYHPISDRLFSAEKANFPEAEINKIKSIYYFTPTGLSGGIKYSPLVFLDNNDEGRATALGIEAAIDFPRNRSLVIGLEYLSAEFEVKEPEEFLQFPIVDPNDPADILHEVKGRLTYLQIPISLRLKLLGAKRFKPVLTIGMVANKPLRQQYTFEYIGGNEEYQLDNTLRNGEFSLNNLRMGLGADYSFGDKLSISSGLIYQHPLKSKSLESLNPKYWSLNVGLNYNILGN